MRQLDVPVLILQHVAPRSLEHTAASSCESRRVLPGLNAMTAGLDADQAHRAIVNERIEDAHGVAPAADARDDGVGEPAEGIETLAAGFLADDGLELADHEGVWMRTQHGPEQVVAVGDVGDPVA